MPDTRRIKTSATTEVEIQAKHWEKNGLHRIYFTETRSIGQKGQACWDVVKSKWIKCHCEFGPTFEAEIKRAFGL